MVTQFRRLEVLGTKDYLVLLEQDHAELGSFDFGFVSPTDGTGMAPAPLASSPSAG